MFKQSRRKTLSDTFGHKRSLSAELQSSVTALCAEPAPTGLLLLNGSGEVLYINSIAEAVLCYPDHPGCEHKHKDVIIDKVRSELLPASSPGKQPIEIVSGRRKYLCRALLLEPASTNESGPTTAIVIERHSRRNDGLRRLCEQFNLTPREREAVLLLIDGLTTKEIAHRMDISPHTVKAFLRLVMTKLGTTTRSGIVGKINHLQL